MKSIFVVAPTLAALLVATGVQGSPTPGDVSSWNYDGRSDDIMEGHNRLEECREKCEELCEELFVGV
jgi:hypothetical protein